MANDGSFVFDARRISGRAFAIDAVWLTATGSDTVSAGLDDWEAGETTPP